MTVRKGYNFPFLIILFKKIFRQECKSQFDNGGGKKQQLNCQCSSVGRGNHIIHLPEKPVGMAPRNDQLLSSTTKGIGLFQDPSMSLWFWVGGTYLGPSRQPDFNFFPHMDKQNLLCFQCKIKWNICKPASWYKIDLRYELCLKVMIFGRLYFPKSATVISPPFRMTFYFSIPSNLGWPDCFDQ